MSRAERRVLGAINRNCSDESNKLVTGVLNQGCMSAVCPISSSLDCPIEALSQENVDSDEEVFFGIVSDVEKKKLNKLKNRRRTAIHVIRVSCLSALFCALFCYGPFLAVSCCSFY